jgi:hypothetical protein
MGGSNVPYMPRSRSTIVVVRIFRQRAIRLEN